MGLKECEGLINEDQNLRAGADQCNSLRWTCRELVGLTEWTAALGNEAAVGWCRSSGTQEEYIVKPVGLGESGDHVKASGLLLPANQSYASVFLTQQIAVALITILSG